MSDCIKRIVEQSDGALNATQAKELIDNVDRLAKKVMNTGLDREDAIDVVVKERAAIVAKNVAKEKANMARNVIVKAKVTNSLNQMINSGMSVKDAFQALLEGVNSPIAGAKDSLDKQIAAIHHLKLSQFFKKLNEENLVEIYNSGQFDDEIGRALWDLSSDKKPSVGNKQIERIAELMHETQENLRLSQNEVGADIERVAGYMMPQRHDLRAMQKAGRDKWANDMLELISDKSFGGEADDLFDVLRGAYDAMLSGVRLDDNMPQNEKLFQFSGPANLAKKVSQSRKIHFRDYDSWKKWNELYGMRTLKDGFLDSVGHQSSTIAMMRRLGTNPEAMLKAVADDIKKTHRASLADNPIEGLDNKLQSMIDNAMGKLRHPASPKWAQWGNNVRMYQQVTKLGGALISSFADILPKSLAYQFQGKTILSSYAQSFSDVAYGFKSRKERSDFANLIGTFTEGMVGDMGSRWGAVDDLSSKAAKLQRMYFKLNGQTWWTDSARQSFMRMTSHHLAQMKELTFDSLDADTKRLFGTYNITAKDWDGIRKNVISLEDGREYIVAEGLSEELALKYNGYLIDRGNTAIPEPGARERRLATLGTQRGTPIGEATRLIMQFKTFPITMATRVWGQALNGKGKADIPAMVQLAIMSAVFGYAIGAMKDIIKGRTPKDPTKPETIYAALAQGGGFGIIGDVLLQDGSFGKSPIAALAGPSAGTFEDIYKIYSEARKGEFAANQALKVGVGMVPGNNLFYVRPALDHMFLLQIQEELNPGYLRRMESNMKRTYGQEFLYK